MNNNVFEDDSSFSEKSLQNDELAVFFNEKSHINDHLSVPNNLSMFPERKKSLLTSSLTQKTKIAAMSTGNLNNLAEGSEKTVRLLGGLLKENSSLLNSTKLSPNIASTPNLDFTIPISSDINNDNIADDDRLPEIPLPSQRTDNNTRKYTQRQVNRTVIENDQLDMNESDIWNNLNDVPLGMFNTGNSKGKKQNYHENNNYIDYNTERVNYVRNKNNVSQMAFDDSVNTEVKSKNSEVDQRSDISTPFKENIPTKKYQYRIEEQISNIFDRASNSFKRLFANEFKALLNHPFVSPYAIDIDEFNRDLRNEIKDAINIPFVSSNNSEISNGDAVFGNIIDDNIKSIKDVLIDNVGLRKSTLEKQCIGLAQLYEKLNDLLEKYKEVSQSTLRELEREQRDLSHIKNTTNAKMKVYKKQLHDLSLKKLELESLTNSQCQEFDDLDRAYGRLQLRLREFETEKLFGGLTASLAYYGEIKEQVESLKKHLEMDTFDFVAETPNLEKMMKIEIEELRNEIADIQFAQRQMESNLKEDDIVPPRKRKTMKAVKINQITETQASKMRSKSGDE